jgi:hypothetical protein
MERSKKAKSSFLKNSKISDCGPTSAARELKNRRMCEFSPRKKKKILKVQKVFPKYFLF